MFRKEQEPIIQGHASVVHRSVLNERSNLNPINPIRILIHAKDVTSTSVPSGFDSHLRYTGAMIQVPIYTVLYKPFDRY